MHKFFKFLILLLCSARVVTAQELIELQPYARELLFTGFTRPVVKMTLTAEVSGKCSEMRVDVGDAVPDNGVISKIDATFVRLDLKKTTLNAGKRSVSWSLRKKTCPAIQI